MKGYVYVLALATGRWYYGCTRNVSKRLAAHQAGKVASTRGQQPKLLATKEFPTLDEARKFESYLKRSKNKSYIAKLFGLSAK